jgi:hypothetical protein
MRWYPCACGRLMCWSALTHISACSC